jgi:hypothetical protein
MIFSKKMQSQEENLCSQYQVRIVDLRLKCCKKGRNRKTRFQEEVNYFKRKFTSFSGILKQYLKVSINLPSLHFAGVNTSSETRFSKEMLRFVNIKGAVAQILEPLEFKLKKARPKVK